MKLMKTRLQDEKVYLMWIQEPIKEAADLSNG